MITTTTTPLYNNNNTDAVWLVGELAGYLTQLWKLIPYGWFTPILG